MHIVAHLHHSLSTRVAQSCAFWSISMMDPLLLFEILSGDFFSIEKVALALELGSYCWHLLSDSQFFNLVI